MPFRYVAMTRIAFPPGCGTLRLGKAIKRVGCHRCDLNKPLGYPIFFATLLARGFLLS